MRDLLFLIALPLVITFLVVTNTLPWLVMLGLVAILGTLVFFNLLWLARCLLYRLRPAGFFLGAIAFTFIYKSLHPLLAKREESLVKEEELT